MATRDTPDQSEPVRKATESLGRAQEQASDAGRQGLGAAQNRIRSLFEQQSHRAADQIGSVAHALRQAAEQLEAENNTPAARYTGMAADRVEHLADTLRNSTMDDLVGQVEGFARRQPEVFLGVAFATGFLFSRFIKSSGDRLRMNDFTRRDEYSSGRHGGTGGGMGGGGGGMGRQRGSRGTYDFSDEQQNIGGSYPAGSRSTGGARGRQRGASMTGSEGSSGSLSGGSMGGGSMGGGAMGGGSMGGGSMSGSGSTTGRNASSGMTSGASGSPGSTIGSGTGLGSTSGSTDSSGAGSASTIRTGTSVGGTTGQGSGGGSGGGTSTTRDAAELMAGGSPEPIKSDTPKVEPTAKGGSPKVEPVKGASTPAETMGATPAGAAAKAQENKP